MSIILESVVLSVVFNSYDREAVQSKAAELLRMMEWKIPVGGLRKADACRHLIAIEFACRLKGIAFSKEKLLQQTRIDSKDYQQEFVKCKTIMQLSWQKMAIVDVLAVQFGENLKAPALHLLAEYKRLYVDTLNKSRQVLEDLTSPVYNAAAFFLAAKQKKVSSCSFCNTGDPKWLQCRFVFRLHVVCAISCNEEPSDLISLLLPLCAPISPLRGFFVDVVVVVLDID
jgi:hypothetical protein